MGTVKGTIIYRHRRIFGAGMLALRSGSIRRS